MLISAKLRRARHFLANGGLLPPNAFAARRAAFCDAESALLVPAAAGEAPAPAASPDALLGMLKGNVVHMAAMGTQYWAVNRLFSGVIVGKAPLPIPQKLRQTLQSGIEALNADSRYIGALSLYLFTVFGIERLISLFSPNAPKVESAPANPLASLPGFGAASDEAQKKEFEEVIGEIRGATHAFLLENALEDFARGRVAFA